MLRRMIWGLVAVAVAGGAGLWWHQRAPRAVRMLPPGDVVGYVNLQPLRRLGLDRVGAGQRELAERAPEYAQFVAESGFNFERDLDAAALAVTGTPSQPEATTAVLEGRFGARFRSYLERHARGRLQVDGTTVYEFPGWAHPRRQMAVALIGSRYVMASNADDTGRLLRRANAWWASGGAQWQGPWWQLAPVGYAAINVEQLAAERGLDGRSPPWRGGERLTASLRPTASGGVALEVDATFTNASDAGAAAGWVQQNLDGLKLLAANAGAGAGAAAVLQRAVVEQAGRGVQLRLTVDDATLRSLF
ncbi:MAG: hypothetical protein ACRD01_12970 [Terriglobales bacterium]